MPGNLRGYTMQATINNKEARNAYNYAPDKETMQTYKLVTPCATGEIVTPVDVRIYMARSRSASTVYCSIWVWGKESGVYVSGKGKAGGYGYHKASAAMQDALRSAEITLHGDQYCEENSNGESEDLTKIACISGVGESAMRAAMVAIARAAGYPCDVYAIV